MLIRADAYAAGRTCAVAAIPNRRRTAELRLSKAQQMAQKAGHTMPVITTSRPIHSNLLWPDDRMAETGVARSENVMMMEKIWMLLPDIHAMKHMNAMFLIGAYARAYSACMCADMCIMLQMRAHVNMHT